jgi:peptide/nickel transport system substrate-binding protein
VVLSLKSPDPSLPAALATFNAAVMPKRLLEAAPGATEDDKARAFAEHPVGSGPFVLASWQRGSAMTLKRNPYYWDKGADGKPLPYLDEVDFQIIPDDATRILKLRAGEVDGAEFIPYARVKELQGDANIDMELFASTKINYLQLNVRDKLADGRANPLADVRVRQALNYAVNKNAIIQIVTHGIGAPMRTFMSSSTPLSADLGPAYPYDLGKARALIAQAGLDKGFEISAFALAGNADQTTTLTALQQMWAQVGAKLDIEQADNATIVDHYHKGEFQARVASWTDDINDPNEIASYFVYYPNIQCQHSGWKNDHVDELFEKSQSETDPGKRAAEYKEMQELQLQAAPMVYLYESPYPVALRKVVKDFVQIPLGNNVFEYAYIQK